MPRQKLCALFIILLCSNENLIAGVVHDLIADKSVADEKVEQYLTENPRAIRESVPHAKLKENQKMGVLEAATSAERWELVCWILEKYPRLDENKPLGTLDNATVLGYAIKQKAAQADRILKMRPGAEPIWNWDFVNNWEYEENKYLRVAAFHSNWKLFREWASEFSATRMYPGSRVWGRNATTRVTKKSILGYIIHDKQYSIFADIIMNHLEKGDKIDELMLVLAQDPVPNIFKKAIYLELMRRVPSRLAVDSPWMSDNPMVVELRRLMNAAAFQVYKDSVQWKLPALVYIQQNDRDLKKFDALNEAVLDAVLAHL